MALEIALKTTVLELVAVYFVGKSDYLLEAIGLMRILSTVVAADYTYYCFSEEQRLQEEHCCNLVACVACSPAFEASLLPSANHKENDSRLWTCLQSSGLWASQASVAAASGN